MNISMKILFNILILFASLQVFADQKQSYEAKVAILDVQEVLSKSKVAQSLNEQISKISDQHFKEISTTESELKKTEEELLQKREKLTEVEFEKEVEQFNRRVSEFQKNMKHQKNKIEQAHAEAIGEIHNYIIKIISQLSKKNNFNMTIPSSQIIYFSPSLDITAEVIKELNQHMQKVNLKY